MTRPPAPALSADEARTVSLSDPEFTPKPVPAAYPGKPGTKPSRAVDRVDFEIDDNGCYVFTGRLTEGYGVVSLYGTKHRAHRAIWLDTVGQIPSSLHLDHLCRNRACINPDHMEPVTPTENVRRGESPTARLARRDCCNKGHEWTPETTRHDRNGRRFCGVCKPPLRKSDAPHGSPTSYRRGCRCEPCRDTEKARQRAATTKRRAALGLPPFLYQHEQPHGTRPRYRAGCRCEPCRQAESIRRGLNWRGPRAGAK